MCRFCSLDFASFEDDLSAYTRQLSSKVSHKARGKCLQSLIDSDNSTYTFHGFTTSLTCGRVLNTQYAENTYSATYVGEVIGGGCLIYLCLFYLCASIGLQIWVCCPYSRNIKYLCCCKDLVDWCENEKEETWCKQRFNRAKIF